MTTINTLSATIPGVASVQRRVVTQPARRRRTVENQVQLDIAEYQRLTSMINDLKASLDEVRNRLLLAMLATGQQKLLAANGTYAVTLKERSNWTYSEELTEALELIKVKQKGEQRRGVAINQPTSYVEGRAIVTH